MSGILEQAITEAKRLPEIEQDSLGAAIHQYIENRKTLCNKLDAGIAQLDAGQGRLSTEVFAELRAKYENRSTGSASSN